MSYLTQLIEDTITQGLSPRSVLQLAEDAVFEHVMKTTRYNQSRAAKVLGISRGTLRTKLKERFGNRYVGTREA